METKTKNIMIRLTEKQKQQIEKAARKAKLGVAPYARSVLLGEVKK